ncbi:MAG: glycosyltransferase [Cytophagaceae bacterium]|jgi:glycosyltransferase involved in cell wall biosynthesis|nr:glycosyltransferase [Cytophagaceae bacterium]
MKKVIVICPHPEDIVPGQRLKYEQYFDYFRANGIEITVSSFMTRRFQDIVYKKGHYLEKTFWTLFGYGKRIFDLFRLPFYDGVYIFLWVTPFGLPVFEFFYTLVNRRIVYDIDDLVFLAPASKSNAFIAPLKGKTKMSYLMTKAKHVITCTPFLDNYARRFTSHTTDISSTINTETYLPVNAYSNESPLVIGWSGSHSTSKYLKLLEAPLRKLKAKYNFSILVIGDASFQFNNLASEAIAWNRESEIKDLQKIDIGLYPLPDEEWVLGKSGLKALQYMALGIPTVATAVGANFRVIEDGVSGFLVKTEDEWYTAIEKLIIDNDLRKRMGSKSREHVEKNYSIHANRDTYLSILKHAIA